MLQQLPREAMPNDQQQTDDVGRVMEALRRERQERKGAETRAARAEKAVLELPLKLAAAVAEVRRELSAELAGLRIEMADLAAALEQIRRA